MSQTKQNAIERLHGLDLLRAAAILMVLAAHYPKGDGGGLLVRALNFGWAGVDLFFVLSGYLIGRQVLKSLAKGNAPSVRQFYLSRLMRTLPCYYFVLIIYFSLGWFSAAPAPEPAWKFLVFAQNFGIPSAFAPSWSLCVEEHFYAVFPLGLLALTRFGKERSLVWWSGLLLALSLALRSVLWIALRPDLREAADALSTYMTYFYYPTYCRLDGIILGVGLAGVQQFHAKAWQRLMSLGNWLVAAGALCFGAAVLALWTRYSFLCCTIGFTLINVSFCLLTAATLSERSVFARLRIPGAQTIALLSYSLYLTHLLAIETAESAARQMGVSLQAFSGALIVAALLISFSTALYLGVERPFLGLRSRLLKTSRSHRPLRRLISVPEAQ